MERGSGACQSRNSSQRVCDSVTAARARRSRHSDCAMRPRLADAPPAGFPTPAPSHNPQQISLCAQVCAGVRLPGTEPAQHGARALVQAALQAAVRPGAVLRRLRAQVQPAARQHQARPLHPTTQSWSAVVRAPGASQQPTKRRRGVTHLHCGPQSTRSARHPPPHRPHLRGARHCGWRNGRNRGTREVFLPD